MDQNDINKIFNEIESIKFQLHRLVADAESEKGTRARTNDRIYKEIESVENELKNLLYGTDRKSGIIVELDRLNQESMERKKTKQNIIMLWITIGGILLKMLFDVITHKP